MNAAVRHSSSHTRTAVPAWLTPTEAVILLACLIAMALVFLNVADREELPDTHTTTVRVSQSETLWDLAAENPVPGLTTAQNVDYIKDLNKMDSCSLRAGESILVPDVGDQSAVLAAR